MEPEVSVSNAPHVTGRRLTIVTGHLCNKGYLFSVRYNENDGNIVYRGDGDGQTAFYKERIT